MSNTRDDEGYFNSSQLPAALSRTAEAAEAYRRAIESNPALEDVSLAAQLKTSGDAGPKARHEVLSRSSGSGHASTASFPPRRHSAVTPASERAAR